MNPMEMTEFMDLHFNGDFKRPTRAAKQKLLNKACMSLAGRERPVKKLLVQMQRFLCVCEVTVFSSNL